MFNFILIFAALGQIPSTNLLQKKANAFDQGFLLNRGNIIDANGLMANQVLFSSAQSGLQIFITTKGITYLLHQQKKHELDSVVRLDVDLLGANISASQIELLEKKREAPLIIYSPICKNGLFENYFYSKVKIKNIYPGVDWIWSITDSLVKYSFELQAGVNPSIIQLQYLGFDSVYLKENNNLVLKNRITDFEETDLKSFQNGKDCATKFEISKGNIVSYHVANCANNKALMIDPTLVWSTNFGGTNASNAALSVDKKDNFFVAGTTNGNSNFPTLNAGSYFNWSSINTNFAFVSKFDKNVMLIWSLIYGGSTNTNATAIKTDNANNVFVCGNTYSNDLPVKQNGSSYIDSVRNDTVSNIYSNDAFLLKFTTNGALQFATYLGGNLDDDANDLDIDGAGNVVVVGVTNSSTFPTKASTNFNQSNLSGTENGFITKFTNAGTMQWSSYFGGNNQTKISSVSIDKNSNIFLVGATNSNLQFPLVNNGNYYDDSLNSYDMFVSKFSSTNALLWSTYFGGSMTEDGFASTIDINNNLIIAGVTQSSNAPIYKNSNTVYFDSILNNGKSSSNYDVLIAKFSNTGNRLWASYLGGSGNDGWAFNYTPYSYLKLNDALASDNCGNFYLSIATNSNDDTLLNLGCNSYFDNTFSNNKIYKFNKSNFLTWATYFGVAVNSFFGQSTNILIAVDHSSKLYSANTTTVIPTSFSVPFSYYNFTGDIVLSRFDYSNFNAGVSYSKCSAGCTGTAALTINSSCNQSGFKYLWSNGNTTLSATNLCTGNYFVTITDTALTCATDTVFFNLKSGFKIFPQISALACPTTCNGVASVIVPNYSGSLQYEWHVNDTVLTNISSVTNVCPQQDTVIVTSATCGADTAIFKIQPYPFLQLYLKKIIIGDLILCPLECNSSAYFTVTGGQATPTLSWSNGTKGTIDTTLCAGKTYTVQATDSVCYYTSNTFTLQKPIVPYPNITSNFRALTCKNIYKIQAYLQNGGHQQPYHYLWNTGDTTSFVDSVNAGVYTCVISDSCTTYPSVTCTILPFIKKPFDVIIDQSKAACDSFSCDGKLSTTIYPINNFWGIPPYKYYWNGVLGTSILDSVCIGSKYKLLLIDACGDSIYDSIVFNRIDRLLVLVQYTKGSNCTDTCNYKANLIINDGKAPITYLWKDGTSLSYHDSLCNDSTMWVLVADACGNSDTIRIYPAVNPFSIGVTLTGYTNCCMGILYALPSFGQAPYHFLWSDGSTKSFTDSVCTGQNYWVIAWDSCGKHDTVNYIVPAIAPPLFTVQVTGQPSCANVCTGSAHAQPLPTVINTPAGVPPYKYLWSNGVHGASNVFNLCFNQNIQCTITDNCGTAAVGVTQIPLISNLGMHMGSSPACIGTCNGIAYAYPTNGAPPYTYYWSGNIGTNTLFQACAGQTYYCKIKDACGDSIIDSVTIPTLSPLKPIVTLSDTKCNFNCDAKAAVSYTGGMAPYFVAWSTGLVNYDTLKKLCADSTYFVLVNSVGCAAKRLKFHVPLNPILKANILFSDSTCANACTGKIKIAPLGGQPPYLYSWSNGAATALINNLCAGIYTCIVTDFCNKKDTISDTIYAHTPLHGVIKSKEKSCINICNGVAKISQYGGAPPYTYLWSNGQTTQQATNLCKGSNYCVVHDSCGYSDTVKFVIGTFTSLKDSLIITKKISCLTSCNGAAKVLVQSGKSPFTFLWSNGNLTTSTTNLCVGNNYCIISDSCGLNDTINFVIDTIQVLKLDSIHATNSSCNNICTGTASVWASGGQPPLTYLWSNGTSTSSILNLCPGIYSVIITNPNCVADTLYDTVKISSTLQSTASVIANTPCFDSCKGEAKVVVVGGTQPYQYLWSNGATTASFNQFCADTFIVKVTDNVGCVTFDTIIITQPNPIITNGIITSSHCFNKDGKIEINVVGGIKPYKYLWNNGNTAAINPTISQGNYNVIVEDSNHCKIKNSFKINGLYPTVYVTNDTLVGGGDTVKLFASGTYKYLWNPATNLNCDTCHNPLWIGIQQQNICVIGIDTFGCSDTACLIISTFDNCGNIVLPKAFSPNNDGINDEFKPLAHYPDCFTEILFRIYDRWGNLIFESTDINKGWDGTYKAVAQPNDAYIYTLDAKNYFGRKIIFNGNVTLVR